MILSPSEYNTTSVYDLLKAAANGQVGLDHRYLHAILDRGEAAIPDIVKFGLEEREEGQEPFDIEVLMLLRALPSPQAIPLLKEYGRRFDFEFPEELSAAFAALGPAAIAPLLELGGEADDPYDIRSTLAGLGIRDQRILDYLVKELDDDPAGGTLSLSLYGDPAAVPALKSALEKITDEDAWTRGEVEKTIAELEAGMPDTVVEPFDIWSQYPAEADPDFGAQSDEDLVKFLDSPSPEYRIGAVSTLNQHELTPKLRARIFSMARHDEDAAVRGACWAALDDSLDDQDIQKALVAKLSDQEAPLEERIGPAIALAPFSEDPVVASTIEEFYKYPEVRAQALMAMWRSRNPEFQRFFPPHLDDADADVKTQAIMGIGWLGIRSQLSKLQEFFADEEYRDLALFSYAMAAPAEQTPAGLKKLLGKIDQLAGGLSEEDTDTTKQALDTRLMMNGLDPVFTVHEHGEDCGCGHDHAPVEQAVSNKVGRNDPCPCGSGKKYKKCCGK